MKLIFGPLAILFLVSCQNRTEIEVIQAVEPTLSQKVIRSEMGSAGDEFTSSDLLDFLAVYGEKIPDVTPAFMNYYQDISSSQSNSLYDNLSEPVGNYSYRWYINNVFVSSDYHLVLNPLVHILPCEGVMRVRLEVTDKRFGNLFAREEWGFLEFVDKNDFTEWCVCDGCPDHWNVFYEFYPVRGPYYYEIRGARWDFDGNHFINSEDLLVFLSRYGTK
jgi:hypothetical protein